MGQQEVLAVHDFSILSCDQEPGILYHIFVFVLLYALCGAVWLIGLGRKSLRWPNTVLARTLVDAI